MLMHITTHIEGRKHEDLLKTVGGRGFPSFFVLDGDGAVLAQHKGPRDVGGFGATMQAATEFAELRKRAESGDKKAQIDYLIARARIGRVTADELSAQIKKLELTEEQQKAYKGVLANARYDEVQASAIGKAFLQMEKDGLVPDDESKRPLFYYQIFRYALAKKDVQLMERAYAEVKKDWGTNARYASLFASWEKQIKAEKEKAGGG